MSTRLLRTVRRLWPVALLLGLVLIEVLGACGTAKLVRRARRTAPLEVRYTVNRGHILWLFTLYRDTTRVEFRYQGQPVLPEVCAQSAALGPDSGQRPVIEQAWRQRGPEARWLLVAACRHERSVYLLRLTAAGPEFSRVGPIDRLAYQRRRLVMQPVEGGPAAYLPISHTDGWLFDERTRRSAAVRLPRPNDLHGSPWARNVTYTVSPDLRVLARVYRPDVKIVSTGPYAVEPVQTAPQRRLVIDQYDLDQRSTRRLTLDSIKRWPPEPLQLTEWTQLNGHWELLPRP